MSPGKRFLYGLIGVIGELLITIAVILALYIVWELWWTSFKVEGVKKEAVATFEQTWAPPQSRLGEIRTDAPPEEEGGEPGEVYALLHVPKWDWNKMPIAEGTGLDILNQAFAGHYVETAEAGQIGNFSIAAHRRTYGNSFLRIDELTEGDKVVVETASNYYVYRVENWEILIATDPEIRRVVAPVPGDRTFEEQPTERWMTMTTCHPNWGSSHRYIVHLKLESWTPKDTGLPAELLDEPTN